MKIIFLEGNIGAGKSTIINAMRALNINNTIMFVQEPVTEWQKNTSGNLLEMFYSDPNRWSVAMQINCYASRMKLLKESIQEAEMQKKMAIVFERSVLSDKLFANVCLKNKTMNPTEYDLYVKWAKYLSSEYMPRVDAFVYIRVPPSVCQNRVMQRDRREETSITIEYLAQLDEEHETWLGMKNSNPSAPVCIIDGSNVDSTIVANQALKFINTLSATHSQ